MSQVTTLICFTADDLRHWIQIDENDNQKSNASPIANDFSFLLSEQQRLIIADIINNEVLRFENKINSDQPLQSNMEMVMKHLYLSQ